VTITQKCGNGGIGICRNFEKAISVSDRMNRYKI